MSDDLDETVAEVLEENIPAVADYRNGSDSAEKYLAGQVMVATEGVLGASAAKGAIKRVIEAQEPVWPVTFTVYRSPIDASTLGELMADELPSWADRPGATDYTDPNRIGFGFDVTVHRDGEVYIRVAEEGVKMADEEDA